MGAWGVKIFQDDIAEDVKDEYINLLRKGCSNIEVTEKLIQEYENSLDEDEISVFWFALASIQWDYGRLLEEVKEKALGYIKSGQDLRRWKEEESEKNYIKRKEVIQELENKLNSEMPKEKRVYPQRNYVCEWEDGDIFAYKIKENEEHKGKYICFIKVGTYEYVPDICPLVYIYNKLFDEIPKIEELKKVKYLPQPYYPSAAINDGFINLRFKAAIIIGSRTKKLINEYTYIGNTKEYSIPKNEINDCIESNNHDVCFIKDIEKKQLIRYENWKDVTGDYCQIED